jgi:phosphoglycolate phosphatase-like HAD superfamily hydrolase
MDGRLILWDIDGTLLSCGTSGREALEAGARAAAKLGAVPHVTMSGKTDPQIIAEMLTLAGLPSSDLATLMPRALIETEQALASYGDALGQEGLVHPGVRELLSQLADTSGVRQTLVTGNIAANARLKVSAFGLERVFDFDIGAYGSDHAERDCLVPIALGRVRKLRGESYLPEQVWVIGDTQHDLSCAKAARVRCLIVGTGRGGFELVRDLDADVVVKDLEDTGGILRTVLGDWR